MVVDIDISKYYRMFEFTIGHKISADDRRYFDCVLNT